MVSSSWMHGKCMGNYTMIVSGVTIGIKDND